MSGTLHKLFNIILTNLQQSYNLGILSPLCTQGNEGSEKSHSWAGGIAGIQVFLFSWKDPQKAYLMHAKSLQSCLALCDPMNCSPPGCSVHGDSPGQNTGAGCHDFLQGIFPTQRLNPGLPYFLASITEEGFLISSCYSLELCTHTGTAARENKQDALVIAQLHLSHMLVK